ncbi:hypothetical protein OZX65_06665 [Leuconostocaceae bacterium ESL0723]|nr:hypothetical protein OZX65_06665 [Leuconostocaceae bacterium ESL0723]
MPWIPLIVIFALVVIAEAWFHQHTNEKTKQLVNAISALLIVVIAILSVSGTYSEYRQAHTAQATWQAIWGGQLTVPLIIIPGFMLVSAALLTIGCFKAYQYSRQSEQSE